jgi:signal transduction histidine kinase
MRSLGAGWGALVAAVLVAALGTAGSVVFHDWWSHTVEVQNTDRLNRSVGSRVSRVSNNLTRYLDALRAVGALVQSGTAGAADRDEQLDLFVHGLDVGRRYTAMQSLDWQIPVTDPQVAGLVSQMRRAGHPGLTITPPGRRTRYTVLVYQYRTEPVASAPGQDRLADPGVSETLDRTRDTGEPGLVPAPAAADRDAGVFLLFLPIYRTAEAGAGTATVPARRAGLLGWVSAQIHADRFLAEGLSGIHAGTAGVQLLDADRRPIAADPDGFRPGPHADTAGLPMAGRLWQLRLAPLPGSILIQDAEPIATIGLLGGIALSLLLAAMTVMITAQARTTRALRTANQTSADMVAMLSHDVRQPLTTIINYSQLVLEDWQHTMNTILASNQAFRPASADTPGNPPDDADIPASLGRVIGAAHRLNRLVDDVLATARLDAIPTHHARPVLVEQVISEAMNDSGAPGMLIDASAVQAVWAYTDPTHLRQIVANLIGNALKYGAPPVTITAQYAGDQVAIDVADAGPGVPAEFINRLFDRFTRAATATAVHGSGFGLYIAQRLAEANGGQITYRPGQPTGACFTLTLPAAKLTSAETVQHTA